MIAQPQYGFAPTMPMMPSMSDMPPGMMGQNMPQMNFKEGGIASLPKMAERVQDAGRNGDTVLAHITPEEAGILQLLGGSGAINPKTGLQEFGFLKKIVPKPIYKLGSKVGKEIERGVESIARNKYLGPIAQMASYLHPVSAFLYAGLAPEGSSFDVKRAAKAAAMQQIGEYALKELQAQGAPGMDGSAAGTGGPYDISDVGSMGSLDMPYTGTTPYLPSPAEVAAAQTAAAPSSVVDAVTSGSTPPQSLSGDSSVFDVSRAGAPAETVNLSQASSAPLAGPPDPSGISGLAGAAGDIALSYGDDALNYALNNKVNTAFIASQVYAGMEAKKELDNKKKKLKEFWLHRKSTLKKKLLLLKMCCVGTQLSIVD
jgi:hypothetical protein